MAESVRQEESMVDFEAIASRVFARLDFRNLFEGVKISQIKRFTFTHFLGLDLGQATVGTTENHQSLGRRLLLMEHRARQKTDTSLHKLGEWAISCFVLDLDRSVCYPSNFSEDPHAILPFPDFSKRIDEDPLMSLQRLVSVLSQRGEVSPISALRSQAVYSDPWGEALLGLDRGIGPL